MRSSLWPIVRRFSSSGSSYRGIADSIERHTRISREHLTPEIQLHLLTPDCPLYTAKVVPDYFVEPFWSIYWPGGQALARYILDEGTSLFRRVSDRGGGDRSIKVLDVGAGCGAASIAAKMVGANYVLANDIDRVACVAASMNARLNGVEIHTDTTDLIGKELPDNFDLILVGDLLYDEILTSRLVIWLEEYALDRGSEVYLADPGRHGFTAALRRKLVHKRSYRLPANVRSENYGHDVAAVWKFLPRSSSSR